MSDTVTQTPEQALVAFWKAKYQRQGMLVDAIISLLNCYGTEFEGTTLHKAFLLTLMGHYGVTDACYYATGRDGNHFAATAAYGSTAPDDLPILEPNASLIPHLVGRTAPVRTSAIEAAITDAPSRAICENHVLLAPVSFAGRLIGFAAFGERINAQVFREAEIGVISALCAVSAATFNNTRMLVSARHATEEAQKLYSVRAEVINRITHEFRTPLTVIKAGLEQAFSGGDRAPWDEPIRASATRLEQLIETLLELNHDYDESKDSTCHPLAAIEPVVQTMSSAAAGKNITIRTRHLNGADNCTVVAKESKLAAALQALLDNAINFAEKSTSVVVELNLNAGGPSAGHGYVFPEWNDQTNAILDGYLGLNNQSGAPRVERRRGDRRKNRFFVLTVVNQGKAIPEDEIPYIYEPFRKASNSPDIGVRGSGLGLTIVQRTARESGGYLCCRSKNNETAMSLFIPVV